jgi:ABC-2 type transport system ATP-binding protein
MRTRSTLLRQRCGSLPAEVDHRIDQSRRETATRPSRQSHRPADAAGMSRIEVKNLTLRYGAVAALDDLTFTLEGHRICGLLGRTGSGKTSLLSVLAGFRKATAGRVRIGGEHVFENATVTRQICFVRGDTVAHDWVADHVSDALATARSLRPTWDAAYAARLADRFGLPLRARIEDLSRGQRSALAITVGLATRAAVTLFDEPHIALDAPSRSAFYDALVTDLSAHPRMVILATHLIEEVSTLLQDVVIIDRGRLVLQDQAERLRSRSAASLQEAFVQLTEPSGVSSR